MNGIQKYGISTLPRLLIAQLQIKQKIMVYRRLEVILRLH